MRTIKPLLAALALACLPGCVHYSHTAANGDRTHFLAFMVKGDASKVSSAVTYTGTNYTRAVGLGAVKGESEVDKLSIMAEAVARGVASGANPVKP